MANGTNLTDQEIAFTIFMQWLDKALREPSAKEQQDGLAYAKANGLKEWGVLLSAHPDVVTVRNARRKVLGL